MLDLKTLPGFQDFSSNVNIRRFSKTRKVRKAEDSILYDSRREDKIVADMVSLRPLSPEIEAKLSFLNELFLKVDDPVLKQIYLLEYDILIEKECGELDEQDKAEVIRLQTELVEYIQIKHQPLGDIEKLCLSTIH